MKVHALALAGLLLAAQPAQAADTYTVQDGDCLTVIAQDHAGGTVNWRKLVDLNRQTYPSLAGNPHFLIPGWVLTLPGAAKTPAAVPAVPAAQVEPMPYTSPEHRYHVRGVPAFIKGRSTEHHYAGTRGVMYLVDDTTGMNVKAAYQWTGWDWIHLDTEPDIKSAP